ncbi:hypothetical protein [Pantoea agglomerans]|uniref:hypothetical protein n=1 Tax=Enterobacter agglomerans TaxID=549 RepID=UPI003017B59E
MKKYPHGITLAAVCNAIEACKAHEDDVPETGILKAFEVLLADSDLSNKLQALAAENAILKNGIGFFSYGTDSGFEEHDSAEKAIAAADSDIDYYRGDACDGWSEETDQTVWGVILQRATMIDERPRTEEDSYLGSHIASICDYALLPNMATPATDAYLNSVRAEGVEIFEEWLRDQAITFDAHGRHEWADKNRVAADKAKEFSAQLRAGKDGE